MNKKIPILDLKEQYLNIKSQILPALEAVLASGSFILGENVASLEEEVARFCGSKFAVGVASGTDALELSLRALGVGSGDEVITTPFTFIATAETIVQVGAKPVFADIKLDTYAIDAGEIRKKITSKTKAVIPVHLYGHPCDIGEVMRIAQDKGLKVIEDCAQAIGSEVKGKRVGAFGDSGAFSFFPTKNLGGYGDGGMITTDNQQLAEALKMLRAHGSSKKYQHLLDGRNSRLDEMQAAILRVKLGYLDKWNAARCTNAQLYNQYLSGLADKIILPSVLPGYKHTYHLYVIRIKERDKLKDFLQGKGVQTAVHYPIPLHLQEVYKRMNLKPGDFPNAELAAAEVLALPMYPELKEEDIIYVCRCIKEFFACLPQAGR
jgi:dTDP-4-amino-4,6-dideoxygalactose transaminase